MKRLLLVGLLAAAAWGEPPQRMASDDGRVVATLVDGRMVIERAGHRVVLQVPVSGQMMCVSRGGRVAFRDYSDCDSSSMKVYGPGGELVHSFDLDRHCRTAWFERGEGALYVLSEWCI